MCSLLCAAQVTLFGLSVPQSSLKGGGGGTDHKVPLRGFRAMKLVNIGCISLCINNMCKYMYKHRQIFTQVTSICVFMHRLVRVLGVYVHMLHTYISIFGITISTPFPCDVLGGEAMS